MDWVHCNSCFSQLEPGIILHLTSCGHMFCKLCLENGIKDERCKICNNQCLVTKLVPDMKPEILDFFTDPEEIVSKLSTVLEFQKQHRMRLTANRVQLQKKYKAAKDEIKRLSEIAHKLNAALKETQQKYRALKVATPSSSNHFQMNSSFLTPNSSVSPNTTPTVKKTAKSTPYFFQSNLVTPCRLRQKKNHVQTPMSSCMSPITPQSAGYNDFLQNL